MRTTKRVSIIPLDESGANIPARSRILIDKEPCESVVAGSYFETALEGGSFYLLFLTDNNPFEDFLNIHMLDQKGQVIDACSLGAPYSTGSFSKLQIASETQVSFNFIGDTVWQLQIFLARRFRLPFVSEPFGVWRAQPFQYNFRLKGKPVAEMQTQ